MVGSEDSSGRKLGRAALFLALSLGLHGLFALLVLPVLLALRAPPPLTHPTPVSFLDEASGPGRPRSSDLAQKKDEEEKKEEEREEKEPERDRGQIVDVAPPSEERRPDDADYLSEYDITVQKETRTDRFRLDSDVRAPQYSPEDALDFEAVQDLGAKLPSSGGTAGSQSFDPSRDGRYANLPSAYQLSNKPGVEGPVPAGSGEQRLSGSPSNDLIKEELGAAMNVNTREILYAGYINRIKRLVSFYWNQNLDNLPSSVRLTRPQYNTVVYVVLDDLGGLQSIEVTDKSGESALDDAVVQAFRVAGPFPNPPEQLIAKDGRVYLEDMGFTVQVGGASRAPYVGIDPRAGVQYPGILRAPN